MTQRLCRVCEGWHELGNPWPRACIGHFAVRTISRSDLPRPTVISDYLEAASPISGEMFTSKADLRRHYRANDVVEVGNEKIKPRDNDEADIPLASIERDVAQAIETLS